ncbi:MAG: hypothetical protein Q7J19_03385 [Lutibacter sp.]|nr:hypothetical protein [Lutibacter sp.]
MKFLALADGANPKSLAGGEEGAKAVWMLGLKKFINFTEKNHQTRLSCRPQAGLLLFWAMQKSKKHPIELLINEIVI